MASWAAVADEHVAQARRYLAQADAELRGTEGVKTQAQLAAVTTLAVLASAHATVASAMRSE